jgi:hypothetical protein
MMDFVEARNNQLLDVKLTAETMLSKEELKRLTEKPEPPCISIFLQTHRSGKEVERDPIQLKNLLRQARERLLASGHRATKVREVLEPAEKIFTKEFFWSYPSDGLALFLSPRGIRYYPVPIDFRELLVVGDQFHVKPLMPLLTGDGRFYILTLSQNQLRLFQGTHYSISELHLNRVPNSLAEALQYDDPERQLQFHTRAPKGKGGQAAMFHGHGVGTDDRKDRILRYFQLVDTRLHKFLRNERAPVLLAGVKYLLPIYREANSYPHLMEESIGGNVEDLSARELHQRAWKVVRLRFRKAQEAAAAQYQELAGGLRTSNDIKQLVLAASQGSIATVLLASGVQIWGHIDPDTQKVHLHKKAKPGDRDLLDFIALQALLTDGNVFVVNPDQVPGGASVAAVLRYPLQHSQAR